MSRIAIVGGGWAGLAAAVNATQRGHQVELFEMAHHLGGRARSVGDGLDNGQHIMIGAYVQTLALMRTVGVDPEQVLHRMPLRLSWPDHEGLQLPGGAPLPAFARGVLACRSWPLSARLRLLTVAGGWLLRGFRCAPNLSVGELCATLPAVVMHELFEPLCVAALNTPAAQASASVFLRVLRDALFSGRGGADLLLPRRPLSELLAQPAQAWLTAHGAQVHLGHRVQSLGDLDSFDHVILATPSLEAARLTESVAPDWAAQARAFKFEPIITVYLQSPGSRFAAPMLALREGPNAPAQFAFDLGQIGHTPGLFSFAVSAAAPWVARGLEAAGNAVLEQAREALPWQVPPTLLRTLAEKRATFVCTPNLARPRMHVASKLLAAGDYIDGPYPATLEGAVRSGQAAAALL